MPSAATATFGRPVPVPATAAGSMSSGPGTPLKLVAARSMRAARTSPPVDQVTYATPLIDMSTAGFSPDAAICWVAA